MAGLIETFLTADHLRIDALLAKAETASGAVDADAFAEFRQALLRHIAMEEKILLPYARTKRAGEPLPVGSVLRRDHGQMAALLVPSPTPDLCAQLRDLLGRHNPLEEGADGLYATCDALAGAEAAQVVERLKLQPKVPLAPHYDGPLIASRRRTEG